MANITRKVDRAIPDILRYQTFNHSGVNNGDILLIKESLGKSARFVTINATGGEVEVRFNVRTTIYKRRDLAMDSLEWSDHLPNVTSGFTFVNPNVSRVVIENNSSFTLDGEFPVDDIEISVAAGAWDIFVS